MVYNAMAFRISEWKTVVLQSWIWHTNGRARTCLYHKAVRRTSAADRQQIPQGNFKSTHKPTMLLLAAHNSCCLPVGSITAIVLTACIVHTGSHQSFKILWQLAKSTSHLQAPSAGCWEATTAFFHLRSRCYSTAKWMVSAISGEVLSVDVL